MHPDRYAAAILLSVFCANGASADMADIQNHAVQRLFMEQPCIAVIEMIDNPKPTPKGMGHMAMAFGFLMGFEAAHPGIRGDHETLLIRLRADCRDGMPETAFDLLRGYSNP